MSWSDRRVNLDEVKVGERLTSTEVETFNAGGACSVAGGRCDIILVEINGELFSLTFEGALDLCITISGALVQAANLPDGPH